MLEARGNGGPSLLSPKFIEVVDGAMEPTDHIIVGQSALDSPKGAFYGTLHNPSTGVRRRVVIKHVDISADKDMREIAQEVPGLLHDEAERTRGALWDEFLLLREFNQLGIGPKVLGYVETEPDMNNRIRVMVIEEAIEGQTLAEELEKGTKFTLGEIVEIAKEQLRDADIVHTYKGLGLVYRDYKLENIMLRSSATSQPYNRSVLLDFGTVARAEELQKLAGYNSSDRVQGTPMNAAPEQYDAQGYIGPRTDIYGLGAVLAQLFLGELPEQFMARHLGISVKILLEDPATIHKIREYTQSERAWFDMEHDLRAKGDIPQKYIEWIMKALQPNYRNRYESAREMLGTLEAIA